MNGDGGKGERRGGIAISIGEKRPSVVEGPFQKVTKTGRISRLAKKGKERRTLTPTIGVSQGKKKREASYSGHRKKNQTKRGSCQRQQQCLQKGESQRWREPTRSPVWQEKKKRG